MPLDSKLRKNYKKITEYTTFRNSKGSKNNIDSTCAHPTKPQKRPISTNQLNITVTSKRTKSELCVKMDDNSALNPLSASNQADQIQWTEVTVTNFRKL